MTFRPLTDAQSEQLDSLRGMSAFAVVIGHANQILIAPAYDKLNPVMGLLAAKCGHDFLRHERVLDREIGVQQYCATQRQIFVDEVSR